MRIGSRHEESSKEKMSRYANGLKLNIQDKLITLSISAIKYAYQYALKVEDKLKRIKVACRLRDKLVGDKNKDKFVIEEKSH